MQSEKLLNEFTEFCKQNPDLRFWQALSCWTGKPIVIAEAHGDIGHINDDGSRFIDTFYFEKKDK